MVQKLIDHVTQKIFLLLLGSCFFSGALLAGSMNDLSLSDKKKMISMRDQEYAYMTPAVRKAFLMLRLPDYGMATKQYDGCVAAQQVVDVIKQGDTLVACDVLGAALKYACSIQNDDACLLQALYDFDLSDAQLSGASFGLPGAALVTKLTCTGSVPCPTMPPTFVVNPLRNPVTVCDLDVARFVACQAQIENLWISGCLNFPDSAELIFTAAQFGWIIDESLINIIVDPQAPPYLMIPSYFTFTSNIIYPASPAASQVIARRMPIFGNPTTAAVEYAPSVDFLVPANFNAADTNSTEVDIAFFTYAINDGLAGDVTFDVYYEFKSSTAQGFGGTASGPVSSPAVAVTNTSVGTDPLNHYKTTVCIPSGTMQPQDQGRLVLVRTDGGATFDSPIFVSSMTFRYPKTLMRLPVTCVP